MGLEHEYQVQAVEREQQHCQAQAQQIAARRRGFSPEKILESSGGRQADDGNQHHAAVQAGGAGVERLVMVFQAAEQEGEPQREQQVGEDGADDRGQDHLVQPGL